MPTLHDALVYTKPNGLRPPWAIFPLRGKVPAISSADGGHGCLDATTDRETITRWWTKYPRANIGIATGERNGIVVLDLDCNHSDDIDGTETLRDLERGELGKLPDTVEALTPNGGHHLLFKYPADYDIRNATAIAPGIDVRANGGYIVAAPSVIRCADGSYKAYQWEASSYPNETELAELPASWLKWLDDNCGGHDHTRFTLPPPSNVRKGTREITMFKYASSLRAGGADAAAILAKLKEYNNQLADPLPEKELVKKAEEAEKRYTPNAPSSRPGEKPEKKVRERMTRAVLAETIQVMGYRVRYNLITCAYEITGRTPAGRAMSQDDLCTLLHDTLADDYKGCNFDTVAQYMTFEARENSYNPVLELLEATPWDGTDRLPQLYGIMGIDHDPLSQTLVRKWLLQTIALLFNDAGDPYGADGCLVLNGPQGTGKTSLFRHLALRDEWFGEGCSIDDHDKDTARRVVTKWLSELGEVESTLKSDISKLKAFITSTMDAYRLPYAKSDTTAPRHTSLCATCNSDRYLIDPTGNRRWWSVPFTRTVPRDELVALDALQLWAQVYATVKPMDHTARAACYRLNAEEQAALAERNGHFEKPSKGQDEVADILEKAERDKLPTKAMTVSEFKLAWDVLRPYSVQQIGVALKCCGIQATKGTKGTRTAVLPSPAPTWHP